MKCSRFAAVVVLASLAGILQAQSVDKSRAHRPDRDRLIGAWHLVRIDVGGQNVDSQSVAGQDGRSQTAPQPAGMLIYTRDGHMSVQLMYPKTPAVPSNEYVYDGYEASFGGYDIDEAAHTLTHHVQGSVTRERLVGQDLPRLYRFTSDGHLVIRSVRPEEHWSVTWERY